MYDFKSCASRGTISFEPFTYVCNLQRTGKGCSSFSDQLQLCGPQSANATEWLELYSAVESAYIYAIQFNSRVPASFPVSLPLQHIVNQTLQTNDTGNILRIPTMLWNWQLDQSECLDWKSPNITGGGAVSGIEMKSFDWITCHYLVLSINSIRNGSMFPPRDSTPTCTVPSWTGSHFNDTSQEWINTFGISKDDLMGVGRLLVTQGGYDPTTAFGPPSFDTPRSSNTTRTVLMQGLSHTEDLFSNLIEPIGLNPELDMVHAFCGSKVKPALTCL
jgi:hypothetical protein